jgi:predicted dehydrogenase
LKGEEAVKKQEIGIGILGTGFMCKAHSNAFLKVGYIYHDRNYIPILEHVGGSTIEKAILASERYGYKRYSQGWQEVIMDSKVNTVVVCLPDLQHKQASLDAIKYGKNVLCEKPLAVNALDAKEMLDAAIRAGVHHMCGFNYRAIPAVQLAKRLIDNGVIGKLYNFNGVYNQDIGANEKLPIEKLWYLNGAKSSGATKGIGCHLIDMSRMLMGEISIVAGMMKIHNSIRLSERGPQKVDKDEEMSAMVEYQNGSTGLLKTSVVASGRKNQLAWEISGSKGSLAFNLEEINILNVYLAESLVKEVSGFTRVDVTETALGHPFADVWWPRGHGIGWEHGHINQAALFLDSIANKKPISPYGATFEDGYKVAVIIEALEQSCRSGKRVYVNY